MKNKLLIFLIFALSSCSSAKKILPEVNFRSSNVLAEYKERSFNSSAFSMFAHVNLNKHLLKKSFNMVLSFLDSDNYRIDIFSPGLPKLLYVYTKKGQKHSLYSILEKLEYTSSRDLLLISELGIESRYIVSILSNSLPSNVSLYKIEQSNDFFKNYYSDDQTKSNFYYKICDAQKISMHGLESYQNNKLYLYAKVNYILDSCKSNSIDNIEMEDRENNISLLIKSFQYKGLNKDILSSGFEDFRTIAVK